MDVMNLFSIEQSVTKHLLSEAKSGQVDPSWNTVTFEGYPTAMLLPPSLADPGSLHYMLFPPTASQRFHHHPSVRYLLIVGDVPVHVQHSDVATNEDPRSRSQWATLPPHTLNIARVAAFEWHRFETQGTSGLGAIAFTVHGDDGISPESANANLMHEVTIYFEE